VGAFEDAFGGVEYFCLFVSWAWDWSFRKGGRGSVRKNKMNTFLDKDFSFSYHC